MVSLLEQIHLTSATWYMATDIMDTVLSKSGRRVRKSAHTGNEQEYIFIFANIVLCHNFIPRDMDPVDVPQNIILTHYINDITLINQYKQEVEHTGGLGEKHVF